MTFGEDNLTVNTRVFKNVSHILIQVSVFRKHIYRITQPFVYGYNTKKMSVALLVIISNWSPHNYKMKHVHNEVNCTIIISKYI